MSANVINTELTMDDEELINKINEDITARKLLISKTYLGDVLSLIDALNITPSLVNEYVNEGGDSMVCILFANQDDRDEVSKIVNGLCDTYEENYCGLCDDEERDMMPSNALSDQLAEARIAINKQSKKIAVLQERIETLESYLDKSSIAALCSYVQSLTQYLGESGVLSEHEVEQVTENLYIKTH